MRNLLPVFGAAALAVLATGCIVPGAPQRLRMYPVQGPLAAPSRFQAITARASGLLSGTITVTLPDGEAFSGPWEPVISKEGSEGGAGAEAPGKTLAAEWDLVYGPGYYVANVLGSMYHMSATLKGDKGSTLEFEANRLRQGGDRSYDPLLGVARDSHGNVFKVIL